MLLTRCIHSGNIVVLSNVDKQVTPVISVCVCSGNPGLWLWSDVQHWPCLSHSILMSLYPSLPLSNNVILGRFNHHQPVWNWTFTPSSSLCVCVCVCLCVSVCVCGLLCDYTRQDITGAGTEGGIMVGDTQETTPLNPPSTSVCRSLPLSFFLSLIDLAFERRAKRGSGAKRERVSKPESERGRHR